MAGMRIGFAIGSKKLIHYLKDAKFSFNSYTMNRPSIECGTAAVKDDAYFHDVTYENGQARERTQVLMDLANQQGGMVIGTGDMSELALGWATYNGDHMTVCRERH